MNVRIATRGSDLALWQARRVASMIQERCGFSTELVIVESHGDKDAKTPLDRFSAPGVFTKALEDALLAGRADVAVHSLKDLPTVQPPELCIAAIPERASAEDLLIARKGLPIKRIGTSSKRRAAQLAARSSEVEVLEIRGNVPTRVEKLRRGDYDAIVLAAAGVERLGLDLADLDVTPLSVEEMVPAPAQGALAIEVRAADRDLVGALREKVHDREIAPLVEAERTLLRLVEGGCTVPLGAHATRIDGEIVLRATLAGARALVRARRAEEAARLAFRALRPDPDSVRVTATFAGRRILVLREPDAEPAAKLRELGAHVQSRAAFSMSVLGGPGTIQTAVEGADWVLFASPYALWIVGSSTELFRSRRIGAVGPGTARELARIGIPIDLLSEKSTGAGLAEAFLALGLPKQTAVLLPRARDGRPELRDALRSAGYNVCDAVVYETSSQPIGPIEDEWDAVLVASPSGAEALPQAAFRAKLVAIGETTAAALRARGFAVAAVAARPTTEGMVEALAAALS